MGGQRVPGERAPSLARQLQQSAMAEALQTMAALQAFYNQAEGLEPRLASRYREFVLRSAEYYLLYLLTLTEAAARAAGFTDQGEA